MASCGLLRFVSLSPTQDQNFVSLRANGIGMATLKKPVAFRVAGMRLSQKNKSRLVVMSMQQPKDELQNGVRSISISSENTNISVGKDVKGLETTEIDHGTGGGDGGIEDGNGGNGRGFGGDSGGGEEEDYKEKEFGPIMKLEEVMKEVEARGATLPSDLLSAAQNGQLRRLLLFRYLDLQGSVGPQGFLMRSCLWVRNRMLADPSFLFKMGAEILIDSACATCAEFKKRGEKFWSEFHLYVSDIVVGIIVDIALVGKLAPYVRIGQPSVSHGLLGRFQKMYAGLPSSVFEAQRPGCSFSIKQRIDSFFFAAALYGSVGFGAGLIVQGIANMIMIAKRNVKKSDKDVPLPHIVKTAAYWGVFLALHSNTRYQAVNVLEYLVEASPLGKKIPPLALAFTFGIRLFNNYYGGTEFVYWAKRLGVQ